MVMQEFKQLDKDLKKLRLQQEKDAKKKKPRK